PMRSPLAGTLDRLLAVTIAVAIASSSSVTLAAPPSAPPTDTATPPSTSPSTSTTPPPATTTTPGETPPATTSPTGTPPADPPPAEPPPADAPSPDENEAAPATTTSDAKPLGSKSPAPRPKAPQGDTATVLEGSPERMRAMQKAGWWTLFGGFVFATVGGVFSGLAERQEDKAERIAVRFDEDSAQPRYVDVKDDYEQIVGRGRAFASTAIALGVIGGALAVAGITLLAVDEARLRKRTGKRRARLELRKGGLQVKF
ncbi:MAG TPA: hypothetical protein VFG69_17320, partial [Nannocystaceae bacterium]|nr:hypothetical protein [Nannocystaceae bacterium]